MAAFLEELFPTDISAGMECLPRFPLRQVWTIGGQRYGNLDNPLPLRRYRASYPPQDGESFQLLRAFFWVTHGGERAFRFQDPADHIATQLNSKGSQISGSTYQLNRIEQVGSDVELFPIYKLAAGFKILRTRSGVTSDITGTTTINVNNGQFIVTGHADGDVYSGSGEFHFPVIFSDPEAAYRVIGGDAMLTEWPGFVLSETRDIA